MTEVMIADLVARCRTHPQAVAVVQHQQETTYGQLVEQACAWAGRLRLRGRSQRFLNISGNKVSAGEVERVLVGLNGVTRARVGIEGTPPQLVATLWLSKGVVWKQPEVVAHCRSRLAEYKIPRRFVFETVWASDLPDKHSVVVERSPNVD